MRNQLCLFVFLFSFVGANQAIAQLICDDCYKPDTSVHCNLHVNPAAQRCEVAGAPMACLAVAIEELIVPVCPRVSEEVFVGSPWLGRVKVALHNQAGQDCYRTQDKICINKFDCKCKKEFIRGQFVYICVQGNQQPGGITSPEDVVEGDGCLGLRFAHKSC